MMREEFGVRYAATQLARRASPVRKRIRQLYLNRILKHVAGPTLDVGCGAGQLLEQLPRHSMGLEVNPVLVRQLTSNGLRVVEVQGRSDRAELGDFAYGSFRTLVLSHVLEHFEDAARVLATLLDECAARGIERVIVVVPGRMGFDSDATHKTFVTLGYLKGADLLSRAGFVLRHRSFFPGNFRWIGRWFIYHELMLIYDRARGTPKYVRVLSNRFGVNRHRALVHVAHS